MKSKLFLLAFAFIMVMGFASAVITDLKEPFKLNTDCINIVQQDNQATTENITFVLTPTGVVKINQVMLNNGGGYFNYTYCGLNSTGDYTANGVGDYTGSDWNYEFKVTKTGSNTSGDNLEIFLFILFIIAVLGLFVTLIFTLVKTITTSETVFDVVYSWCFYLLTVIVYYISANYINSTYIESITSVLIKASAFSNVILPLIALIITIFYKSTQKKKPLSPQEITGRMNGIGGRMYG